MYETIPMTSLTRPHPDHPPPYESHVNGENIAGSQLLMSPRTTSSHENNNDNNNNTNNSLDRMIADTESALHQSRMVYGAENHPGYHQLQELLRLLRDPVFAEIYRFNLQNQHMFNSHADSSALPEHFYRVHFPARPGSTWRFSIAPTELNGDPSEVSLPEHENMLKLVVGGVEPEEQDPQEAHLRDMITPGDELIQINGNVVAGPKELKAQTQHLSGRHQATTFIFLQINPTEMNNISMLRFQEQRLVLHLQSTNHSFGFAIVTNQSHRITTIQKIVPDGSAYLDGRLRKGDILEYINNMSVAGLNSNDVVALLKSSGPQVTLTVLRYERLDYPIKFEKHLFQFYHVSLSKQMGSLGINIRSLPGSSDMSDQRLFIKDLVPGSVADVCGLIQPMDQIIAVNGRCIVHLNKDESLKMLKQHDQVHVTFLREVEPLPFSVNNTKSDSSINQPSRQERMMLYRETLSDKFEVSQGEVLFYDLKTQMKQFQARDGSTSYIIENATPARNFPTFSKSVSTCALESGDEILEVDGIQVRDNPSFTLEALPNLQNQHYNFDNDRKIHIVYARPTRSHQQPNIKTKHSRHRSMGSDKEDMRNSNPQLSTFATSHHLYSMPDIPNLSPRHDNQDQNLGSDRSNETENFDQHNYSTERLIKCKDPNLVFQAGAQNQDNEDLSKLQKISPGQPMFLQNRLGENSPYNRLENSNSPTSSNRYKGKPTESRSQGTLSPVNTSWRKIEGINTHRKDKVDMQVSGDYDLPRKSMMTEYRVPVNATLSVCDENMWDSNVVYCTLQKKAGKTLGITISETTLENSQPIIIIDEIVPGGVAEKSRVLASCDRIVQVQNYDTKTCTPEEFVKLISSIPSGKITLGIQKYTGGDNEDQPTTEGPPDTDIIDCDDARPLLEQNDDIYDEYQANDGNCDTANNEEDAFRVRFLQRSKGAIDLRDIDNDSFVHRRADNTESVSTVSEAQNANYRKDSEQYDQYKYIEKLDDWPQELQQVIRIERRQREPMGIGLVSAEEVTHMAPHRAGMYIRAVTQEGLIGRDGRLREGDFLVGINGHDLSGVSLNELAAFMQNVASLEAFKNFVELVFVPGDIAQQFFQYQQNASGQESFTSNSNLGSTSESPRASLRQKFPSCEVQGAEAYMEEESGTDQSKSNSLDQLGRMANDADDAYDSLNYQEPYSAGYASMWEERTFGEKRLFEISRSEGQPLGLSIVDYPIGIIVQSVQEGSPADLDGPDRIQPWDRLTSINGIDLTNMTKNEAIEVIKGAKSPMRFVVQAVIFVENFDKPSLLSKHISDDGVSENESQ